MSDTGSDRGTALIIGAGAGLSASLAKRFNQAGMNIALAARNIDKLSELASDTGAKTYPCDVAEADQVDGLFASVVDDFGTPDVVIFNASARVRGPITEIDPEEVKRAVLITGYSGFLVGQAAAKLIY